MNFLSKILKRSILVFSNYSLMFFKSTGLMLILFIFGYSSLSADIAIVSSFVIMICNIISYNERAIINADIKVQYFSSIYIFRLISFIFIFLISFFFLISTNFFSFFSVSLVLVFLSNWVMEIFINSCEVEKNKDALKICLFYNILYFSGILYFVIDQRVEFLSLFNFCWSAILMIYIFIYFFHRKFEEDIFHKYFQYIFKNFKDNTIFSSLFISSSNFFFRYFILMLSPSKSFAGSLFAFFAITSLPGTLYNSILGPSLLRNFKKFAKISNIFLILIFVYSSIVTLIFIFNKDSFQYFSKLTFLEVLLMCFSSLIIVQGLKKRFELFHETSSRDICFQLDIVNSLFIICIVPILYLGFDSYIFCLSFFFTALFTNLTYSIKKYYLSDNIKIFLIIIIFLPIFFVINENGLINFLDNNLIQPNVLDKSLIISIGTFLTPFLFFYTVRLGTINKLVFWIVILNAFLAFLSITVFKQNLKFLSLYNLMMFVFPILSFAIGYSFLQSIKKKEQFFNILLYFSGCIIVFQILHSLIEGKFILNNIYFGLSIYKNLQYSSQALALIFFASMIILFFKSRLKFAHLILCNLIVLIYVILSNSITGIFIFMTASLILYGMILKKNISYQYYKYTITTIFIFILLIIFYLLFLNVENFELNPNAKTLSEKIQNLRPYLNFKMTILYSEVSSVLQYNNIFFGVEPEILENLGYFKSKIYFIDYFLYLGLITFIPILFLILKTMIDFLVFLKKKDNSPSIIVLASIVFQYLFFDTFFKSSLREAYISNIIFIFWGFLYYKIEKSLKKKF